MNAHKSLRSRWLLIRRFLLILVAIYVPRPEYVAAQVALVESLSDTIHRHPSVRLGETDGPWAINGRLAFGWKAPWGDYLVTNPESHLIWLFDGSGRPLEVLDNSGEGPGEFGRVTSVVFGEDSIFVFDGRQPRFTVLNRELELGRTQRIPVAVSGDVILLVDTMLVAAAHLPASAHVGNPLQAFGLKGRHYRSFGRDGETFRAGRDVLTRIIAPAGDEGIWAARSNEYRIDRVAVDGSVVATYLHMPEFFPEANSGVRSPTAPPPTALVDLSVDHAGLIWLTFAVADERWREAVDTTRGFHGGRITDFNRYYDSVIDVVDPSSGRILARRRFESLVMNFPTRREVAYFEYINGLYPVLQVDSLTLASEER